MGRISRFGNALYEGDVSIDFVGRRRLWYSISALIVIVAALGLWLRPLNLGIEFVGGTEYKIEVGAAAATQDTADRVSDAVAGTGIAEASSPVVTTSGDSAILVQTEELTTEESRTVRDAILEETGTTDADLNVADIGASWGEEVAQRALQGLAVFLVLVVLFIWAYFREWKMSAAALVALAHDVLITIGIYAWSGFEVTPSTVTGLLTILGFSLYDTVVVFDKVRENTADLRGTRQTYAGAANLAVNQTLVRSINTSIVALLPVGAILYIGAFQLGAGSLKDLALSLFVGMAAGVYSSVFIATPLLVQMKGREKYVLDAEKRAAARRRAADRYAEVPTYKEDLPVADDPSELRGVDLGDPGEVDDELDPDRDEDDVPDEGPRRRLPAGSGATPRRPGGGTPRTEPLHGAPLGDSKASGRTQPSRQPRSKRGR